MYMYVYTSCTVCGPDFCITLCIAFISVLLSFLYCFHFYSLSVKTNIIKLWILIKIIINVQ